MKIVKQFLKKILEFINFLCQTKPKVPAVKPTIKKNTNSVKSLGIELTIKLS